MGTIEYRDKRYETDVPLRHTNIALHGFTYDHKKGVWYTRDPRHCVHLLAHMTPACRAVYEKSVMPKLRYEDRRYEFVCPESLEYLAIKAGFMKEGGVYHATDWRAAQYLVAQGFSSYETKLRMALDKHLEAKRVVKSHDPGSAEIKLAVPTGLDYLPYQKSGILYASERKASIIGDEMGCISGDAEIDVVINSIEKRVTLSALYKKYKRNAQAMYTRSYHKGKLYMNEIVSVLDKGVRDVVRVELVDGRSLVLTADHEVLLEEGKWVEAGKLTRFDRLVVGSEYMCLACGDRGNFSRKSQYPGICKKCNYSDFRDNERAEFFHKRACRDALLPVDGPVQGVISVRVASVVKAGQDHVYDLVMRDPARNFVVNGIVVHNCGKTIQAIGAVNISPVKKPKVLITTLASLKLNWKRECEKWFVKDLRIQVLSGKSQVSDADVYVINYDVLDKHEAFLVGTDWDFIIMDEAHELRNRYAKRTKVMYRIQGKKKIALTGTPVPNRPAELYGLLNYLQPSEWGTFEQFGNKYCAGHMGRFGYDTKGASNLDELSTRIRSQVMIRRLKADVLPELPSKTRQIIPIEGGADIVLQERQVEAQFDSEVRSLETDLARLEKGTESYRDTLARLQKARVMKLSEMARMSRLLGIEKVPYVIQYVRDVLEGGENKVVLFAVHKAVIEALVSEFKDICVSITGDTSMEARQRAVDAFQNDKGVRLFIGNIKAAGTGITLTSAHHVIFAEFDWVPGLMQQCEDRCHRIGAKSSVLVQYLAFDNSLDINKLNVLNDKEQVQYALLDKRAV